MSRTPYNSKETKRHQDDQDGSASFGLLDPLSRSTHDDSRAVQILSDKNNNEEGEIIPRENLSGEGGQTLNPVPMDPSACVVVQEVPVSSIVNQGERQEAVMDDFRRLYLHQESTSSTFNQSSLSTEASQPFQQREAPGAPILHSDEGSSQSSKLSSNPSAPTDTRSSSDRWDSRYKELLQFVRQNGHCQVPTNLTSNQLLSRWCKRQRYQKKLKEAGEHSTLTDNRERLLNDVGFVWDIHEAIWMERYMELVQFNATYRHTVVPRSHGKLGQWVKSQRRQYALHQRGEASHLTQERISKLNALSFEWVGNVPTPENSGPWDGPSL